LPSRRQQTGEERDSHKHRDYYNQRGGIGGLDVRQEFGQDTGSPQEAKTLRMKPDPESNRTHEVLY
jgi:hypothetical protein